MNLDDIMTPPEAERRWGLKDGTVRSSCTRGKLAELIKEGLVKKSEKTWIVTKKAMEKVYGEEKKQCI